MSRIRHAFERLHGWPRRTIAVGCLLLAALTAWPHKTRPPAATVGPTTTVVLAARSLPAGTVLTPADVTVAHWPTTLAPDGALTSTTTLVGRQLAGPVNAREALTGSRLVGARLADGLPPGTVGVPVTLADPNALSFVHAGDHVDLLVEALIVARHVLVLAVVTPPERTDATVTLIVAVGEAAELALAAASSPVGLALS